MDNRVVLIIDDEIGILNMLSRFLRRKGFEVRTAVNLLEGERQLKEIEPDFLFLDVHLPDGNGLETLPHLKQNYPNLTVIMMSAFDQIKMRSIAKSQGALAFLSKPFSLEEVDQIVLN